MKYIVTPKAEEFGFSKRCHRQIEQGMILNEKEAMCSQNLHGTLHERNAMLEGTIYTDYELYKLIND